MSGIFSSRCPFPSFVSGFAAAAGLYIFVQYFCSKNEPPPLPTRIANSEYRDEVEAAIELAVKG